MKTIILILIILSFSNCLMYDYDMPYYNISLPETESRLTGCHSLDEKLILLSDFVLMNIEYIEDNRDSWQTPEETINRGKGDCEDISLLWMWLVYQYTGSLPKLIVITSFSGWSHAYADYRNQFQFNFINHDYYIKQEFNFYDAVEIAEYYR